MSAQSDPFRLLEPKGKDISVKGDSNEHRAVATLLERGYNASLVDLKNSKYDIVIEVSSTEFLRLQVKTADSGSISLIGGVRGGRGAIHSDAMKYWYTPEICDCLVGVVSDRNNGGDTIDFYVVPTLWIENVFQQSIAVKKIQFTKNNFELLELCRNGEYVNQLFNDVKVKMK